jgi:hypothetical protein
MMTRATIIAIACLSCPAAGLAVEFVTRGNNLAVDAAADARLLMDLSGVLWVVPTGGGEAQRLTDDSDRVSRPRWSPSGEEVVYATNGNGAQGLRVHSLVTGETRTVSARERLNIFPDWHPDGSRIVFSSDRRGTGLDIWEVDLPTGLEWRLSRRPGDETEPAWSASGRDLVYVHHSDDQWSLVLREHGQPEEVLVTSPDRLAGPSWRPDGSLITFWRDDGETMSLDMVILAQPRLVRHYMSGEKFTPAPVSWPDKNRFFYTAGGAIRQRLFNAWSSRTVPFRAMVEAREETSAARVRRSLPRIDEPAGSLVIHAARMFDGVVGGYQVDRDILIEGGRIRAVEAHAERPGQLVIDLGDLVVMPGFVDARARLPNNAGAAAGPLLLAAGLTTLVADHARAEHLNAIWSGKELPGPRLLPATDWPVGKVSGLADSQTPGLDALLASRPARLVNFDGPVVRRFSQPPIVDHGATEVVIGSHANGMPAGIGTHAELRALQRAGLDAGQALRSAGVNAAAALGVDPKLGRIATGAVADLILVDGDPLRHVDDAIEVVAVVRNGRFFSIVGLIDRAATAGNVE